MKNTALSVLILIMTIVLSFLLCAGAEKLVHLVGMHSQALIPAVIVTITLYPILRSS